MAISSSSHSILILVIFLRFISTCYSKTGRDPRNLQSLIGECYLVVQLGPEGVRAPGPPNWYGVLCIRDNVHGLNLNHRGLGGTIDVESLMGLKSFRVLGAMNNNFQGPLPNFKKLGSLKFLYLSRNNFSGEIPDDAFSGMQSLKKVHLAHNQFSGAIPSSLATSKRLIELMIENNNFYGQIPIFNQDHLTIANFSNNNLEGEIPAKLSGLKAASFSGNIGLCGKPLEPCKADKLGDSNNSQFKTLIIVGIAVLVVIAVSIAIIFAMRKRQSDHNEDGGGSTRAQVGTHTTDDMDKMERGSAPSSEHHIAGGGKRSTDNHATAVKLSFLRSEEAGKFDLSDLLKASAEVLGNGMFGSTYKAGLSSGPVVVVKRFRQMSNVEKEDFVEHMRRLGRLNHKNLLPILAFYYRKEEKLLVFDYVQNSSLAYHLHGKKSNSNHQQQDLDWPTRLKIIKGVARGMLYLFNELPSMTVPNGHLKSSNVLLDSSYEPLITDYGLLPIVNQDHAEEQMIAFRSPDFRQGGRRLCRKTDVWSLGTLILETLTGKFSTDVDVVDWVRSTVPNLEVLLDEGMTGVSKNSEGEIVKLLRIALSCCEVHVEERWDMREAVERIEEVRERNGEDDFYSSYTSDDVRSSRGVSEDFNHVPLNL